MTNFINGLLRFRRGPWEMLATIIIALGVFMLMQPFVMWGGGGLRIERQGREENG